MPDERLVVARAAKDADVLRAVVSAKSLKRLGGGRRRSLVNEDLLVRRSEEIGWYVTPAAAILSARLSAVAARGLMKCRRETLSMIDAGPLPRALEPWRALMPGGMGSKLLPTVWTCEPDSEMLVPGSSEQMMVGGLLLIW